MNFSSYRKIQYREYDINLFLMIFQRASLHSKLVQSSPILSIPKFILGLLSLRNGQMSLGVLTLGHVNCWTSFCYYFPLMKWKLWVDSKRKRAGCHIESFWNGDAGKSWPLLFFVFAGFLFRVRSGDVICVGFCARRLRGISYNAFGRCAIL